MSYYLIQHYYKFSDINHWQWSSKLKLFQLLCPLGASVSKDASLQLLTFLYSKMYPNECVKTIPLHSTPVTARVWQLEFSEGHVEGSVSQVLQHYPPRLHSQTWLYSDQDIVAAFAGILTQVFVVCPSKLV